jgi:outer membrane protein assembly factor BamA
VRVVWVLTLAVLFAVAPAAAGQLHEVVAGVQIHGNTLTPDADLLRIAGIEVGAPVQPDTVETVAQRLRASRRFESVDVLKRFASISDPSQILLVIVVDEGAVRIERTGDPEQPTRIVRSRRTNLLFLPILNAEDGYGLTYGVRLAWPDPTGKQSRVSIPASWGGEKRVGLEFEKTSPLAWLDRVSAGASLSRRTNPYYDRDDDRTRAWIRGERSVGRSLRAGIGAGVQRASFLDSADLFAHVGADITLDTRIDTVLPRNAVYVRASWEHVGAGLGADRIDVDARGYVPLYGQSVIALRGLRAGSNRPLPPFLKPLLGGMANLRGFAAGTQAADNVLATSAEVIVPLTSPMNLGRVGVSGFIDAGTAWDDGERLRDQRWREGVGGSLWFSAAFLRLTVAIAHGRGSSTRVHVGANVSF